MKNILICDDDEAVLQTLIVALERDFSVFSANNGEEAILLARENPIDIVITDMKLPTINGTEVFMTIKEMHPEVKGILMSGLPEEMQEPINLGLANHAHVFISKPLNIKDLLKSINSLI